MSDLSSPCLAAASKFGYPYRHHVFREQQAMTGNMQDGSNDHYRKALNTALRILTRRDHSKYELSQKLKARSYTEDVIGEVMSECERFGYINDERTAEVFIRQLHKKGYGMKRIRFELKSKGFRGKHVQGILAKRISEADERQCAEKIFQKHANRFDRDTDEFKRKDKIYRFLFGRGFSNAVISQIIAKFS
jgi:regulatory protein